MRAAEALQSGDLAQALTGLKDEVRRKPSDPKLRVFLSQLFAVCGDWDRSGTQLKVLGELDAGALPMVKTYTAAIACELQRGRVFAGETAPLIFGKPEHWIALLLESLRLHGVGEAEKARELRAEAFDLAPAVAGEIDGEAFAWIADGDMRLGPVLEAIINGTYYWVPFARIRDIQVEAPADLRDAVWTPVQLTWTNGGETVALVPTRYPGTESSEEPLTLLARRTEWLEDGAGDYLGLGQRMFATDTGEYPIMDVRRIELEGQDSDAAEGET